MSSEHVIGPESIITTTIADDNTIQVTTADSDKDKPMDALAKCIEETIVTGTIDLFVNLLDYFIILGSSDQVMQNLFECQDHTYVNKF